MTYTDPNGLVEWEDWVDISKIKVPRYGAKHQFSDLPEGKYILYRTGGSWLNGRAGIISYTEKKVGKQWPYVINTDYMGAGKKKLQCMSIDRDGYVTMSLVIKKSRKTNATKMAIHSTLMKAFHPQLFLEAENPEELVVHHKGRKVDYRECKLGVITNSENMLQKNRHNAIEDYTKKMALEEIRTGFSQGGSVGPRYSLDEIVKRLKYGIH